MKLSEEAIIAGRCRESYRHFFMTAWPVIVPEKLVWNFHLEVMCDELQEICERIFKGEAKTHDTIFNISPGSSKSMIGSVMLLPWCWTRMPSFRFIGASYSSILAMELSRKSRDVVKSDWYRRLFPEVVLRDDQDSKGHFVNTKMGSRFCVSTGSRKVTGMHSHLIMIDDPVDPMEAESDLMNETANVWIKRVLMSRKIDRRITATALIMQRLRQGDPTDEMAKRKNVRHFIIPALSEYPVYPEELLKYYSPAGEMDPVRLPMSALEDAKVELGEYGFAGQYGQSPVPADGAMFMVDRIQKGVPPKKFRRRVRFWDKAGKKKGDWTVGVKIGLDYEGRYWILDVIRERKDTFARERMIRETAARDTFNVWVGCAQAPGEAGMSVRDEMVKGLPNYRVKFIKETVNKETRAELFSQQVNANNVYMAYGKWNQTYIEELKYFPLSSYDDQVDSSSGGFQLLLKKRRRIGGARPSNKYKSTNGGRR